MVHSNLTVLVVEDEILIRLDVVAHLLEKGFVVREASNATEAIEQLVTDATIEAIFTDIDMPGGMNGLKLAAAVRDRWPSVRIVVTSGKWIAANCDMPAGAMFLPKPYRLDRIEAALSRSTAQPSFVSGPSGIPLAPNG